MKLKALITTVAIAALGVSVAAATASPNHGKPPHPGAQKPAKPSKAANACKGPQARADGHRTSPAPPTRPAPARSQWSSRRRTVAGRRLGLVAGSQVSVNVDARTKYRRHGHASLADLLANDRLNVKARACKSDESSTGDSGSGSGTGSDQPSNPAPTKGKGHGKRHADVASPASFTFLARKVDAHPPKPPKDGGDTGTTGTRHDQRHRHHRYDDRPAGHRHHRHDGRFGLLAGLGSSDFRGRRIGALGRSPPVRYTATGTGAVSRERKLARDRLLPVSSRVPPTFERFRLSASNKPRAVKGGCRT